MAAAAKAAGWPDYVVETAKSNLLQTTRMQLDMMDQVMDAWTEQMKSPGKLTLGNAFAKGFPGLPAGQGFGDHHPVGLGDVLAQLAQVGLGEAEHVEPQVAEGGV
ncbi:MAG: hypothetical protein HC774_06980 [Sphingomonadales bacterium]|nr:hypothetical protein [Sphingomonadales bacterium]